MHEMVLAEDVEIDALEAEAVLVYESLAAGKLSEAELSQWPASQIT